MSFHFRYIISTFALAFKKIVAKIDFLSEKNIVLRSDAFRFCFYFQSRKPY